MDKKINKKSDTKKYNSSFLTIIFCLIIASLTVIVFAQSDNSEEIEKIIPDITVSDQFHSDNEMKEIESRIKSETDYVEPLVNLSNDSFDKVKTYNFVKDFKGVPDGKTNNHDAWNKALEASIKEPIKLIIPEGEYYSKGDGNIETWPKKSKGIYIIGENYPVIMPENSGNPIFENYFLRLQMSEDSIGVRIEGIIIDGSHNPQDLFFTMDSSEDILTTPLQRGIRIDGANDIFVSNVEFRHMYGGYAIHAEDYRDINIQDVYINDVGGEDITRSFGYGFFFGSHDGDAVINIDNVHAKGKVSDRNPINFVSRAGIVLENLSIQSSNEADWLKDINTTVNITNSSFIDYKTVFHIESLYGNVYWNVDNLEARAKNYMIASGINGEMKERTNKLIMDMMPWGKVGMLSGIYYTENERDDNISGVNSFNLNNSTINLITYNHLTPIRTATSSADSVVGNYYNSTFNNVAHKLVSNASAHFINTQINLHESSIETFESIQEGPFSEPDVQTITFDENSSVNQVGEWKSSELGESIDRFVPHGYEPPELDEPMVPMEEVE